MKYTITGGNKLSGEIPISGNKNSVFPCVAAALLTDEEVILENIPHIDDTQVLVEILKEIGVDVSRGDHKLTIKATKVSSNLPQELMVKLRGSIVLAGAILAREGKVKFYHPGGDIIGKRSIQAHLEGFKELGYKIFAQDLKFNIHFEDKNEKNLNIFLPERSVTATENLILSCALSSDTIVLRNCASEPHVVDLCQMLVMMGVSIRGIGTDTITITGREKLNGGSFRIREDYIEVGTYAVAAAITAGNITLTNLDNTDLDPVMSPFKKFGIIFKRDGDRLEISAPKLKAVPKLITNVWPGFPTDLMSEAIVLATKAKGVTLCHDWMYESRMFFVDKLISMGANITISDPHRVLIYGPTTLKGRELESPDIRAGMALVLAALSAKGQSIINKAELIERGYEDVVGKLTSLGANIKK